MGSYVPAQIRTNLDLEKLVDTSDEWIVERTGIRERRIAAPDETSSILGARAGLAAIRAGKADRGGIVGAAARRGGGEAQPLHLAHHCTGVEAELRPGDLPGVCLYADRPGRDRLRQVIAGRLDRRCAPAAGGGAARRQCGHGGDGDQDAGLHRTNSSCRPQRTA